MVKTLRIKIVLVESDPIIWRMFAITDDYRMDRFHQVLQIVMGWNNSHLHEFKAKGRDIGMIDETYFGDFPDVEDETKIYLRDLNLQKSNTFSYLYDFGDNWEHKLFVEEISDSELRYPQCMAGQGACPPDDCGGVWGYTELLEVLKDKSHPEYEEYIAWLPTGFRPDSFPLEATNKELKAFGAWHRKHPRKKSTPWHRI